MDANFLQTPLSGTEKDFSLLKAIGQGKIILPETGILKLVSSVALATLDQMLRDPVKNFQEDKRYILEGLKIIKNHKEAEPIVIDEIIEENKRIANQIINILSIAVFDDSKEPIITLLKTLMNLRGSSLYELNQQSQKYRSEVVRAMVLVRPIIVMATISSFRIEDQELLIEIAKLCQKTSEMLEMFIDNFGIQDQEALLEIAKLCIAKNVTLTMNSIQRFGLQDQGALVEILKVAAEHDAGWVVKNIQNLGIEDQAALIEIAKICARKNPGETVRYSKNFGIRDQGTWVEIVKVAAEHGGGSIAERIHEFGIQDQVTLIEIAKICARQDGENTAKHIQNFGIHDQGALVEIAKLCIQGARSISASTLGEAIKNFGIQNQGALLEVAKLFINHFGFYGVHCILDFGIKGEPELIEIMKFIAAQDGEWVVNNVKKIGIKDQKALLEIAKLCAKSHGKEVARNIKDFEITDQEALTEIAKLCAEQDGEATVRSIYNFKIKNEKSVFRVAVKYHPQCAFLIDEFLRDRLNEPDPLVWIKKVISSKSYGMMDANASASYEAIVQLLTIKESDFLKFPEGKREELLRETKAIRESQIKLLYSLIWWMLEQKVPDKDFVKVIGVFPLIAKYQKPDLKWPLLLEFVELARGGDFPALGSEDSGWITIQKLLSKRLIQEGVSEEKVELILARVGDSKLFRDGKNQRALHEAMQFLLKDARISCGAKERLLDKAIGTLPKEVKETLTREEAKKLGEKVTDFLHRVKLLPSLLLLASPDLLSKEGSESIHNLLELAFKESISIGKIDDFGKKYEKMMDSSRMPFAFLQYYGKLQSLVDKRVDNDLAAIITAILEDRWIEFRHDTASNAHLKVIAEKYPSVLKQWFTPSPAFLLSESEGSKSESTFSYGVWCKQKLIDEYQLGDLSINNPLLYAYLTAKEAPEREKLHQEIRAVGKKDILANRVVSLLISKAPDSEAVALKELLEVVKAGPFYDDLSGRLRLLQGVKAISSEVTVVDTEDWNDFQLCGVEIPESCQNIGGNPQLNKGLLGYFRDGKIRMVAIKEKEGPKGRLIARALIKLLWDGEKPVLFLDRVYDSKKSDKNQAALLKMAKQKAKELGVPLVTEVDKKKGGGDRYPKELHSLGGPATFEYCDHLEGVSHRGIYTVYYSDIIQDVIAK